MHIILGSYKSFKFSFLLSACLCLSSSPLKAEGGDEDKDDKSWKATWTRLHTGASKKWNALDPDEREEIKQGAFLAGAALLSCLALWVSSRKPKIS